MIISSDALIIFGSREFCYVFIFLTIFSSYVLNKGFHLKLLGFQAMLLERNCVYQSLSLNNNQSMKSNFKYIFLIDFTIFSNTLMRLISNKISSKPTLDVIYFVFAVWGLKIDK